MISLESKQNKRSSRCDIVINYGRLVSICSETGNVMSITLRTGMLHQLLINGSGNFRLGLLLVGFLK